MTRGARRDAPAAAAYGETVRVTPPAGRSRDRAHLVTEARQPMSADISRRERRYLVMMGFRVFCFLITIVMFTMGAGWLTAIPAVGAIVIPYFAVIIANGGREPHSTRGFRAYEPNLPEPHPGPSSQGGGGPSSQGGRPSSQSGRPSSQGAPAADGRAGPASGGGAGQGRPPQSGGGNAPTRGGNAPTPGGEPRSSR